MSAEEQIQKIKELYEKTWPQMAKFASDKSMDVMTRVDGTLTLVGKFFGELELILFTSYGKSDGEDKK